MAAVSHSVFGRGDFSEGAPEMNGGGAGAITGLPRNRGVQSVVDLEDSGTVSKFREAPCVGRWKPVARDSQQLHGCHVAKEKVITTERGKILDSRIGPNCSAQRR